MAGRNRLTQKQSQSLSLTPAVRLSLSVLQMNAAELEAAITTETEENPFLVVSPPRDYSPTVYDFDPDGLAAPEDLGSILREQIRDLGLNVPVLRAARAISWSLDAKGYLTSTLEEIAELAGVDPETASFGLEAIQSCEPSGVGARDGSECLVIQLVERGIGKSEAKRAIDNLALLVEGKFSKISKRTELTTDQLQAVAELLPSLTLDPAESTRPEPASRIPDLEFIHDQAGQLTAIFLPGKSADLAFDRALLESMPQEGPAQELARRAQSLLEAMEYRRETVLRIGNALAERQASYFVNGARSIAPLSRREIAEELKISASTVSRAVSEKSFLFQGRVHELSDLFSSGVKQSTGNKLSATSIKARIAEIIKADPVRTSLSDTEITRRLQKEGVDIARRTVAKYRQCLNIPSSFQRQRIRRAKRQGIQTKPRTLATDD